MIKTAIAIGVGIILLLALCFFITWGVWKLRRRMSSTGQISAIPEEIPVEDRNGLKKKVATKVKTSDLKLDSSAELKDRVNLKHQVVPLRSIYSKDPSAPSSPKSPTTPPSWVLVNRPVPLPRTGIIKSSSSSERFEIELNPSDSLGSAGEAPLLKYLNGSHVDDLSDLEKCIDISFTFGTEYIPVEKRHSSAPEKGADSNFSFGISGTDAFSFPGLGHGGLTESADATTFRSSFRRSRGKESTTASSDSNPSTRFSRTSSRGSRLTNSSSSSSSFKRLATGYGHPQLPEVSEYGHAPGHLSLTTPPDQRSLDVFPAAIGSGSFTSESPQPSKEPLGLGSIRSTSFSQQVENSSSANWERV